MAEAEAWVMIPKPNKDKTGCVLVMRPLVLCKDCKWYLPDISWCNNSLSPKEQTFFCADGEKKDETETISVEGEKLI